MIHKLHKRHAIELDRYTIERTRKRRGIRIQG